MTSRRVKPKKHPLEFRPSSVHQHEQRPLVRSNARQSFAALRPVLLASRPVTVVDHPHWKDGRGKPVKVQQFGRPTFRNVIEDGRHQ